jgi:hypothetical protein
MKLSGDSIVDTVIDYANVKFGVEMEVEQISNQLKNMSFGQTLKLVDAIKNEDDEAFSSYIDMSSVNEQGYGTAATAGTSRATTRDVYQAQHNNDRRDTNLALKSIRSAGSTRAIAGGNKVATGTTTPPDVAAQQRDANTAATQQIDAQADQNSKEIDRLRQLINKGRQ